MAKIVVGSPSLTQPLLLYPGLGPAMLDNIGGVSHHLFLLKNNSEKLRSIPHHLMPRHISPLKNNSENLRKSSQTMSHFSIEK
jgi:hypothetical protein